MKRARIFSLLAGVALLGVITRFNATAPDAQAEGREGGEVPPRAADADPAAQPANPLWALPLIQLSATRERPIFSPSRRLPPPPPQAYVAPVAIRQPVRPPEPERPQISLLGTIIGAGDQIGVFLETATHKVVSLRIGEDYHGWILRLVKDREVTLVKDGDQAVVLELPSPGANGPAALAPVPGLPMISRTTSADEQPVGAARGGRRPGR